MRCGVIGCSSSCASLALWLLRLATASARVWAGRPLACLMRSSARAPTDRQAARVKARVRAMACMVKPRMEGAYTLFPCKWEYIAFDQEKWIFGETSVEQARPRPRA